MVKYTENLCLTNLIKACPGLEGLAQDMFNLLLFKISTSIYFLIL
jgi:hypothetical protein